MASIDKRPNGTYRARVFRNGKMHSATRDTLAAARAWAQELEGDIDRGGHKPGKHTVADAVERFRDVYTPTRRGARWEALRLSKFLRDHPDVTRERLDTLTPDPFIAWKSRRLRQVSPGSVLRELNLWQSVIEYARIELRWIKTNPVKDVARPDKPPSRRRRVSDAEARTLCKALGYFGGEPENTSQRVALAFLFAIETGMRSGEITSLEWVDVYPKFAHLSKTKNGDDRDVPLSPHARELLALLPKDARRVFNVDNGTRDKLFRDARDRAKLDGLTFHDSRHEATTRLARKLDVLDLAAVIGHRDLRSLRTYYNPTADELADRLG